MSSRRSVVVSLGLVLLVALAVQGVGDASAAHTGPPRKLVLPTISGSALQGGTLMASTGSWSELPTRYAYSWSDCNQSGTNCVSIAAASAAKLTLVAHDVGHTIRAVVTASNSSGSNAAQSAPTSVVQPAVAADVTPPSLPSALAMGGVGQTAVTLSWAASSDNVGVIGYRLFRAGAQVGTTTGLSYTFTGLTCATSYTLAVAAVDAAGNISSQTTLSATTSQCSSPPSMGSASMANLWVGLGGSGSCVRSVVAVGYAAAVAAGNVCDSGPTAYTKAQLGDTVLVEGGTYTSQWYFTAVMSKSGAAGTCNYNYGGTPNLSNCVTFEPAPGQTVSFQVAGSNAGAIKDCASFLSIRNVNFTATTYQTTVNGTQVRFTSPNVSVGSGDNTCGAVSAPHDDYFANLNGQASGIVGGSYNVWFVGGTSNGVIGFPWQMGGEGDNGTFPPVHNSGIVGITFSNFVEVPPAHFECIHMDFSGVRNTVADNVFENCPIYAIRVEAEGPTTNGGDSQTNNLIENNWFDGGGSSGALNYDCHDNNCVLTGNTARFNSFNATGFAPTDDCALVATNSCTDSGNVFYGNIDRGTCPSNSAAFGLGWTTSYDVWTGTQGGICAGDTTSDYNITVTYTSPGFPNYNLSLAGTQTATDFVPASVGRPATDVHGNGRPTGPTNAGADER